MGNTFCESNKEQDERLAPPNFFCGLPVVLPDVPIKHSFSVHEPSLNSCDLESDGKGSLFKSMKDYECYTPKTE